MNPTEKTPDFREVADLWRSHLARFAVTERVPSAEEAQEKLRAAFERFARRWSPPAAPAKGELAAMIAAWRPEWSAEMRRHERWPIASARIAAARSMLARGDLDDARFTIASILGECCLGAQAILAMPAVRAADPRAKPISDQAIRDGLDSLLRWLEVLRDRHAGDTGPDE